MPLYQPYMQWLLGHFHYFVKTIFLIYKFLVSTLNGDKNKIRTCFKF